MSDDVVIRIEGLWKRYGLGLRQRLGAISNYQQWLRSLNDSRNPSATLRTGPQSEIGNPKSEDGPWALRDINLEVRRGETLGIIGRNGAGKSTLLKILAGVTPPTRGRVEVRGRVFPMIELNAGLHMELTGRENVHLLGAIMGFSREEIEAKMPQIEEFTGLGEWFDKPVRMYSSGMLARLGFGVAMNADTDILLIDEVLAVGDLAFQRKCYDRLEKIRSQGTTVLFVSHNTRQVERICDRCTLLSGGEIVRLGKAASVVNHYFSLIHSDLMRWNERFSTDGLALATGTGEVSLTSVSLHNSRGESVTRIRMFEEMIIRLEYEAKEPLEKPVVAIGIRTTDMLEVTNFSTDNVHTRPSWYGRGTIECRIPSVSLLPGVYVLKVYIRRNDGLKCYRAEKALHFQVVSDSYDVMRDHLGFFYMPVSWTFKPESGDGESCKWRKL